MLKNIKRSIILLGILVVCIPQVQAQNEKKKKSIIGVLWGDPIPNAFTFMPTGTHYVYGPDVIGAWYSGLMIKGFELSVFLNSKNDWTTGLIYNRAWNITKKFAINCGGGVLYGYKGKLSTTRGIPVKLAQSFLFTGPFNPVVGVGFDYKLSERTSIHASLAPLIIIYGLRFYL